MTWTCWKLSTSSCFKDCRAVHPKFFGRSTKGLVCLNKNLRTHVAYAFWFTQKDGFMFKVLQNETLFEVTLQDLDPQLFLFQRTSDTSAPSDRSGWIGCLSSSDFKSKSPTKHSRWHLDTWKSSDFPTQSRENEQTTPSFILKQNKAYMKTEYNEMHLFKWHVSTKFALNICHLFNRMLIFQRGYFLLLPAC